MTNLRALNVRGIDFDLSACLTSVSSQDVIYFVIAKLLLTYLFDWFTLSTWSELATG